MASSRPVRAAKIGVVTRVEQLTPHMVRVVVGGEGLAGLGAGDYTDHYVKVLFPPAGVSYPEPFDVAAIRESMPREAWPVVRTYTIRRWLPEEQEMWIDFVVHGDAGIAGPWAARAKPGDPFRFMGPGGGYAPDPAADWHLLAGDESALPAIAASLEALPAGASAHAVILVENEAEEQQIVTKADAQITWLHRSAGDDLVSAVRALPWRDGVVQAFVHGEAGFVRELRRYLLDERGMPRELLSISGYWRLGKNDEAWREEKAAERAREK